MGYYLETPNRFGKADSLVKMYNGRIIDQLDALEYVTQGEQAVIVVVRNPEFEAAAFCHSLAEYKRFTYRMDPRPRTWVVIDDRALVEQLSGYAQDMAAIGEE